MNFRPVTVGTRRRGLRSASGQPSAALISIPSRCLPVPLGRATNDIKQIHTDYVA